MPYLEASLSLSVGYMNKRRKERITKAANKNYKWLVSSKSNLLKQCFKYKDENANHNRQNFYLYYRDKTWTVLLFWHFYSFLSVSSNSGLKSFDKFLLSFSFFFFYNALERKDCWSCDSFIKSIQAKWILLR